MAVSKRTRFEVFKRDLFTCQYCGRTPPVVTLECDHIEPVAGGGGDHQDNLITACFDCNRGKSDRQLDAAPSPLADQIADRKERSEQLKAYSDFQMQERVEREQIVERLGLHWFEQLGAKEKLVFGTGRVPSIRTFLKTLTEAELMDAIDIAMFRRPGRLSYDEKTWKYFCGVCWSKIRECREVPGE